MSQGAVAGDTSLTSWGAWCKGWGRELHIPGAWCRGWGRELQVPAHLLLLRTQPTDWSLCEGIPTNFHITLLLDRWYESCNPKFESQLVKYNLLAFSHNNANYLPFLGLLLGKQGLKIYQLSHNRIFSLNI